MTDIDMLSLQAVNWSKAIKFFFVGERKLPIAGLHSVGSDREGTIRIGAESVFRKLEGICANRRPTSAPWNSCFLLETSDVIGCLWRDQPSAMSRGLSGLYRQTVERLRVLPIRHRQHVLEQRPRIDM